MRRIALLLALASMGFANAQNSEMATSSETQSRPEKKLSPDEKAKRDAGRAEKTLGLNADQKSKWETAARERIAANTPLKEKSKTSSSEIEKKELRKQMMENNKKFNETVVAFLTPEQKTKWDKQKEERKQHHRHKMHRHEN